MVDYDLINTIKKRLKTINYEFKEDEDNFLLEFTIDKNINYILNQTNLDEVPRGLMEILVDMVIADFLQTKWATNTLDIESLDFTTMVSRIVEGDTSIDILTPKDGAETDEGRFLTLLNELRKNEVSFAKYRRFIW